MTFASQSGIILTSRPAIISTQPYAKVSLSFSRRLSHFVAIKFVLWRQLPQDIKSNKKVATAIEAFCGDIYDSGRTHSLSQKRERLKPMICLLLYVFIACRGLSRRFSAARICACARSICIMRAILFMCAPRKGDVVH
jgi:hypothetical protein